MNETVRCIAFVDLDDTLFSSARKQPEPDGLVPAALLRTGAVVSYSNPAQRGLRHMLECAAEVIPVTARSVDGYRRVLLPFAGRAVVSYGATILLPDGQVDGDWAQRVAPHLVRARADLESLVRLVAATYDAARTGLQVRLVSDARDPAYLVVKHVDNDEAMVQEAGLELIGEWLARHPGFTLHINGNNLAVIPPGLGKEAAVAYLIEQERQAHGALFTVGAGDSLTDLDFMRLCDVAIVPGRSQLADALLGATTRAASQRRERQRKPVSVDQPGT
jgi:hydroxymethylpyrimidine pyrophosphatase-like HAD family hydrolase